MKQHPWSWFSELLSLFCIHCLVIFSPCILLAEQTVQLTSYKTSPRTLHKSNFSEPIRTILIHQVRDYATWKKGFDDTNEQRLEAGELSYEAGTSDDDLQKVHVLNSCAKKAHFVHWIGNPELKDRMQEIGVIGEWNSVSDAKTFFEDAKLRAVMTDAGFWEILNSWFSTKT